jgi:hypothetical protein
MVAGNFSVSYRTELSNNPVTSDSLSILDAEASHLATEVSYKQEVGI